MTRKNRHQTSSIQYLNPSPQGLSSSKVNEVGKFTLLKFVKYSITKYIALAMFVFSLSGCGGSSENISAASAENIENAASAKSKSGFEKEDDSVESAPEIAAAPISSVGATLDAALEDGTGPSMCAEKLCAANRKELPTGRATYQNAPTTVVPEPPRIERILRQSELANPQCLADCPINAKASNACSNDCRGKVVQPSLPAFRTSTDGRLALPAGSAGVAASLLDDLNGVPLVRRSLSLYKNAFSETRPINLSSAKIPPGVIGRSSSPGRFFCGLDQAPRVCGQDDCYDLTLVEPWKLEGAKCPNGWPQCSRMAAVPVTVRVQDPKTKNAKVVSAKATGDWVASRSFPATTVEPIVTADGRLIVFRLLGGYPIDNGVGLTYSFVKNDQTIHEGRYSLSYAYSDEPCDVRAWFKTNPNGAYPNMKPWSAAHYDDRLKKYGFSAYPLRDAYGKVFEEGDLVRGSYPWIDRRGNNVIFSTVVPAGVVDGPSTSNIATRYPMSIEHPKLGRPTSRSPRGFAVAGSWTHGKIVMLDGIFNNEDYGIDAGDTRQFELYRSAKGTPVNVRVDGNSNTRAFPTPGTRGNTQHIESLENTYAMHTGMRAVTPRDVVWTMSRGDALSELAFDDMLDPHVLLFAPMNAAWKMPRQLQSSEMRMGTRGGKYQDGFQKSNGAFVHDPAKIAFQNAATSPIYPVALPGKLSGEGRVEPVAQGGIEGRGLWLEGNANVSFEFPKAQGMPQRSFYVSTFFDSRSPLKGGRRLFTLEADNGASNESGEVYTLVHPGGISVTRVLPGGENEIVSFPVAQDHPWRKNGWHHIGILFGKNGLVTAFVDGDPVGRKKMTEPVTLTAGARVVLGGQGAGFKGVRGWFDELRLVTAGEVSQLEGPASIELLCNYARGTMASIGNVSPLFASSERSPAVRNRARIAGLEIADDRRLRCVTDYSQDLAVRIPLPQGEISLRSRILEDLTGNSKLIAGVPRPDTTQNAFCLSCHESAANDPLRPRGLAVAALVNNGIPVELDPRTQPGQPYSRWNQPAYAHGVIPAQWFESIHGVSVPVVKRTPDKPLPILEWQLRQ
ncbi:hypothetical protein TDB9533_00901 [Thalassocella blandensis]|nr:hypothetical protein TDB9533_00901 [Thalassocella blandensis]